MALLIACNEMNKPMTEAQKEAVIREATLMIKNVVDHAIQWADYT